MWIIDCEVFQDYFLLACLNTETREVLRFEQFAGVRLNAQAVDAFLVAETTFSFNGLHYDLPILAGAVAGFSCEKLKAMSDRIIVGRAPSWRVLKENNLSIPAEWNHVDVMPVLPGKVSLKIYGGRLHAPMLQSLPYAFDAAVTGAMRDELRRYCVNDLETTELAINRVRPQLDLRRALSRQYGMDLRSKGDAQIAEAVILHELEKTDAKAAPAPDPFRIKLPPFLAFQSEALSNVARAVTRAVFAYGAAGNVLLPKTLAALDVKVAGRSYKLGIGGLHSVEKCQLLQADDSLMIVDLDVSSFYPAIMLGQNLFPPALGHRFVGMFRGLVERRIAAKRAGNSVEADTLKIVINASYGLTGSKYSPLFSPDLMIQTTMSGQLALLMLIEAMDAVGVSVMSANTDGIVCVLPRSLEQRMLAVAWDWELDTGFNLERADYSTLASRDVNNYVAVKTDGKVKRKGCFAPAGVAKNPDCEIVYDAVTRFIALGSDVKTTIESCDDVRKFLMLRTVNGGAVWRGQDLGKAVRYYYSTMVRSDEGIRYALNGNLVPKSSGARPLMDLPERFPLDVDLSPYVIAAERLLCEVGF